MNILKAFTLISLISHSITSCNNSNGRADAYGNFEATEITVSAGNNGKLIEFNISEGQKLSEGAFVGFIDTVPLALNRQQLLTSKDIIRSKSKGVLSQIAVINAQLKTAELNRVRMDSLIKDNAGTQKQLDDIMGEIDILHQQINSIKIQNTSVLKELENIDAQIEQINDKLMKSIIINPVQGTVLVKYAEPNEISAFGKPLYKIADLSIMQLRVFISEKQLSSIKIGQKVVVKIDSQDGMKDYEGVISWISSEAEFTPKIIQTKEERVALVYAMKVDVLNDGSIKIGMPAELWMQTNLND